jgi:cyclic pyranopterin phosphate synthase
VEYLRLSVTDRCNLRCAYCRPRRPVALLPRERILSYEEMLRLARLFAAAGIRKVRLTGGEPLVRRGLAGLVRGLAGVEGLEEVTMTTNGTLLARHADELRLAGLARLNVSLDSLWPERYRRITGRPWLERVLAGLERAAAAGFSRLKLNAVVRRGVNDDEVPALVELARRRDAHVRFIEYMPVGRESGWSAEEVVPSRELMERVSRVAGLVPVAAQGLDGPAQSFLLAGGRGGVGFISGMSNHFCGQCNRLRLTPEGRLRICLFSDRELDLGGPLRRGAADAELAGIIARALELKRPGQGRPREGACRRPMYNIGG